ncbi:MAG: hypothetical protein FWC32_01145 [Firmicutes bacterium]|nr:hypothetical protein [Bacillota bacterium]
MKKVTLLIVIATILILSACNYDNQTADNEAEDEIVTEYFFGGDLWIFENIGQLNSQTTDVVRAVISNSRVEPINTLLGTPCPDDDMERFYITHTVYQLNVLEVFKGNSSVGDVLEIMQLGGLYNNRELIYPYQLSMNSGDEFILFLQCFEEYGFGHLPMSIVGSHQGVFYSLSSRATQTNDIFESIAEAYFENHLNPNETLENVSPNISLTLTIGDLMQIRHDSGLE